jgi:hypothetical protein
VTTSRRLATAILFSSDAQMRGRLRESLAIQAQAERGSSPSTNAAASFLRREHGFGISREFLTSICRNYGAAFSHAL